MNKKDSVYKLIIFKYLMATWIKIPQYYVNAANDPILNPQGLTPLEYTKQQESFQKTQELQQREAAYRKGDIANIQEKDTTPTYPVSRQIASGPHPYQTYYTDNTGKLRTQEEINAYKQFQETGSYSAANPISRQTQNQSNVDETQRTSISPIAPVQNQLSLSSSYAPITLQRDVFGIQQPNTPFTPYLNQPVQRTNNYPTVSYEKSKLSEVIRPLPSSSNLNLFTPLQSSPTNPTPSAADFVNPDLIKTGTFGMSTGIFKENIRRQALADLQNQFLTNPEKFSTTAGFESVTNVKDNLSTTQYSLDFSKGNTMSDINALAIERFRNLSPSTQKKYAVADLLYGAKRTMDDIAKINENILGGFFGFGELRKEKVKTQGVGDIIYSKNIDKDIPLDLFGTTVNVGANLYLLGSGINSISSNIQKVGFWKGIGTSIEQIGKPVSPVQLVNPTFTVNYEADLNKAISIKDNIIYKYNNFRSTKNIINLEYESPTLDTDPSNPLNKINWNVNYQRNIFGYPNKFLSSEKIEVPYAYYNAGDFTTGRVKSITNLKNIVFPINQKMDFSVNPVSKESIESNEYGRFKVESEGIQTVNGKSNIVKFTSYSSSTSEPTSNEKIDKFFGISFNLNKGFNTQMYKGYEVDISPEAKESYETGSGGGTGGSGKKLITENYPISSFGGFNPFASQGTKSAYQFGMPLIFTRPSYNNYYESYSSGSLPKTSLVQISPVRTKLNLNVDYIQNNKQDQFFKPYQITPTKSGTGSVVTSITIPKLITTPITTPTTITTPFETPIITPPITPVNYRTNLPPFFPVGFPDIMGNIGEPNRPYRSKKRKKQRIAPSFTAEVFNIRTGLPKETSLGLSPFKIRGLPKGFKSFNIGI